jgi:phosphohistidine phosphatase SixA
MITQMMRLNIVFSRFIFVRLSVAVLVLAVTASARSDDSQLWQALKTDGHVGLLRHALAPGTGDPPGFQLDDCTTQRNLSGQGRAQAKRISSRFHANGIEAAEVYSSEWCRCLETAALLDLGPVNRLEAINSFFQNFKQRDQQTASLEKWIRSRTIGAPIILVTHQVNITALTGRFAASGELIVINVPDSDNAPIQVVGTLQTQPAES